MINKGLHNTVENKAVACNIIEKIIKRIDRVLETADEHTLEDFEDLYEDCFNDVKELGADALAETNDLYKVGQLIEFLIQYDKLPEDIVIYTTERYVPNEHNKHSRYSGVTKLVNGAEVYVMHVFGEESGYSMCQVLYFDGEQLKIFTPFEGNFVNIDLKVSLGDESNAPGVDCDEAEELFDVYLEKNGIKDINDESIDWEAVCNEIDAVLV